MKSFIKLVLSCDNVLVFLIEVGIVRMAYNSPLGVGGFYFKILHHRIAQ